MDSEDRKILQHMSDTLDEVLIVMKKPENIIVKILGIAGMVVSILGILGVIEIIRNWRFGG